PRCDLETAKTLHTTLLGLIQSGLVKSAHDCSEGGLAVCLAESCISQLIARETPRLIGATIDLKNWEGQRVADPNQKDGADKPAPSPGGQSGSDGEGRGEVALCLDA